MSLSVRRAASGSDLGIYARRGVFDVDDFQLDSEILNGLADSGRNIRVCDNGIDISDIGYFAEAAPTEFR